MAFAVRPMEERDLLQCAEVERDAFPALFPPTSFQRELKNKIARYMVATRVDEDGSTPTHGPQAPAYAGARPLINRLIRHVRRQRDSAWQVGQEFVAGFVGIWYMVDEAHIVAVGVRSDYRGKGVGELLLISAIEQALEQDSRMVTLEVRVSNSVARKLYEKFGLTEQGVRKGYYTDNREDALIMSTGSVHSGEYTQRLDRLVRGHSQRWGRAERRLS
jgi:ribosomal-protein-alanine N-acetyltransferase